MTREQYLKVLPFVWVCKERGSMNKIVNRILTYRFCKDKPSPIPNPNMIWQKPLFEELRIINETMMLKVRKEIYESRSIF